MLMRKQRRRENTGRIRQWIGTFVLLFLAAVVAIAGYAIVRVIAYEQLDDPLHLREKQRYLSGLPKTAAQTPRPPNVVIILFDDLGYGDLGAYGSQAIQTPSIDALAAGGARLTSFYSAAPYCTPSRAGMLTGRYPPHTGLNVINFPDRSPFTWLARLTGAATHLPAEEITIADALGAAGYATALFGKWHLGHHSPARPNDFGFQEFFGLHHSNDMSPLPLWHNDQIVEADPVDQTTLTRRYTEGAVRFIDQHKDRPFFVYLAHTFPHIPLHVREERRGRSDAGLYGDVVEELDSSVGEVVRALMRNGLEHETLVIVTSDNGPWYQGSPGSLRGRKNDVFEGGMRVPFIASWPGRIPAGRTFDDIASGVDLLPTVLDLARLPAPPDRQLDGVSLMPLLQERGRQPHEELLFFKNGQLLAIRSGRFKYHRRQHLFPGTQLELPVMALIPQGPWLFDLQLDGNESYDVSARQPGVAHRLSVALEAREREFAANPRGWKPVK